MATPAEDGFFMPAEWEHHTRCWMAWPCREDIWKGNGIDAARTAYVQVAKAIAKYEPLSMVCNPDDVAEASVACGPGIEIVPLPITDSWMRDSGPTFVVDGRGTVAGVHWQFNAWGGMYPEYSDDAMLGRRVIEHLKMPLYQAPLVLEGGAITVDGEGTLITTERVLLDPHRNPGMTKAEVEEVLSVYTGAKRVIWLPEGYEDDETGGHIDEIAAFLRPGVVAALMADDPNDNNTRILQENLNILNKAEDAQGRPLEVVPVRQPSRRTQDGHRLTLSYLNFYFANGAVILPSFQDSADREVYRTFRRAFPDREIVQLSALDIVPGGGGIHCITLHQPA